MMDWKNVEKRVVVIDVVAFSDGLGGKVSVRASQNCALGFAGCSRCENHDTGT
jgi:hypothetical protein